MRPPYPWAVVPLLLVCTALPVDAGKWNYETHKAKYLFCLYAADTGGGSKPDGPVSGKCLTCNGSGKWMLDGRPQGTCPDCDGTGKKTTAQSDAAATIEDIFGPQEAFDLVNRVQALEDANAEAAAAINDFVTEIEKRTDDEPAEPAELQGPPDESKVPDPVQPKPKKMEPPKPPVAKTTPAVYTIADWEVTEWSATWCGYCRKWQREVQPELKKAGVSVTDPIDVELNRQLTANEGIKNIPVFDFICKRDKRRYARVQGYMTTEQVLVKIRELCGQKNAVKVTKDPTIKVAARPMYPPNTKWRTHHNGVHHDQIARTGTPQQVMAAKQVLLRHLIQDHGISSYKGHPLSELSLLELYWMHCDQHPIRVMPQVQPRRRNRRTEASDNSNATQLLAVLRTASQTAGGPYVPEQLLTATQSPDSVWYPVGARVGMNQWNPKLTRLVRVVNRN